MNINRKNPAQPDASENIRRIFNNELLDLSCRFGYPKMLS
jgi:hypothetical protein